MTDTDFKAWWAEVVASLESIMSTFPTGDTQVKIELCFSWGLCHGRGVLCCHRFECNDKGQTKNRDEEEDPDQDGASLPHHPLHRRRKDALPTARCARPPLARSQAQGAYALSSRALKHRVPEPSPHALLSEID